MVEKGAYPVNKKMGKKDPPTTAEVTYYLDSNKINISKYRFFPWRLQNVFTMRLGPKIL